MARFFYAISALFSVIGGAYIGYWLGCFFAPILMEALLPASWMASIVAHHYLKSITMFVGFCGGGLGIYRFSKSFEATCELFKLKRRHRMVFYGMRHWYVEPFFVIGDLLWVVAYALLGMLIPPFATVFTVRLMANLMAENFAGLSNLLWLPGAYFLYLGFQIIPQVSDQLVDLLFQPRRLMQEIEDAPLIREVLRIRMEEARRRQEELRGDNDPPNLPGGRS